MKRGGRKGRGGEEREKEGGEREKDGERRKEREREREMSIQVIKHCSIVPTHTHNAHYPHSMPAVC